MRSSREVLKLLREDGWEVVETRGDHVQLRHPTKPGKVTVQHPVKDLGIQVLKWIEAQSGIKLR